MLVGIESFDEKTARSAQRVLDLLDKLDARMESHFARERDHVRHRFRGQVRVCIPDPREPLVQPRPENSFLVWGRSLSESGMSFIHPDPIHDRLVLVGIDLGKGEQWFQAEIVRQRELRDEGFHEYGVVFRSRA